MSKPEFDHDDPDSTSMFDFLAEEGAAKHRRKMRAAAVSERPLPIIRKPVPVSESGPLLPPKPGAPVEPPPALTSDSMDVEEDLDFLDDMPGTRSDGMAHRPDAGLADSDSNITRLDPRSQRAGGNMDRTGATESRRVKRASASRDTAAFDDLVLDLDDAPEFRRNRKPVRVVAEDDGEVDKTAPGKGLWLALALLLIGAGTGSYLITNPPEWRALVKTLGIDTSVQPESSNTAPMNSDEVAPAAENVVESAPSPLLQRFREQLSLVEGLIADAALDDAAQALSSMDRTVYGYGATEFAALENRIEQLRSGVDVAAPATEQAATREQARAAAEGSARASAEQAAREDQAKLEAQAAREAEARIAAEQAAQEESARLAATQQAAAREEQARVAAQQAVQAEQARLAAESARQDAARLEQARQEEQARVAARNQTTSDKPSVDADRQATDRRIAEERAALQRQKAREQRLTEAREREAALAALAISRKSTAEPNAALPSSTATPAQSDAVQAESPPATVGDKAAPGYQSIDDDELQTVYRRFIDLQQAVSRRDINAVVSLTARSGVRVQQLMQMFENSALIDARIRNVSTSNATGQIKGTLQINRIKRTDGTFVEPPAALSSIPLSSQREGDGWSAISW